MSMQLSNILTLPGIAVAVCGLMAQSIVPIANSANENAPFEVRFGIRTAITAFRDQASPVGWIK